MGRPWNEIYGYVKSRVEILGADLDSSRTKAELANLRRGIGKTPGEDPKLWGSFLLDLPKELEKDAEHRTEPTFAEWAAYTALALYALHQQGNDETVNCSDGSAALGRAIRKLVHSKDDEERIMRRFSAMATSAGPAELAHHLRSIIQLLRAEKVKLDYADLARDLYLYQLPDGKNSVRLKWGRDYYREEKTNNELKEGEE
ncbi:MAG TPA: type I-E CRISPR-associated protein Cse2/CasB [Candidatus Ornithomonoglobus merdipullorum]|uniref:Type I-E CRISPR-associated protein Cse2/CasB n=1 Tax=Candidatus Ornithomonoglobus merdipullorum TaxID=2840895 RepID=A0A9D1MAA9_9FIRM|nr:type I-E CRISPR-associated protein Cse2/CasB [Candidatus Ornithomonoglobus merdipullorum]